MTIPALSKPAILTYLLCTIAISAFIAASPIYSPPWQKNETQADTGSPEPVKIQPNSVHLHDLQNQHLDAPQDRIVACEAQADALTKYLYAHVLKCALGCDSTGPDNSCSQGQKLYRSYLLADKKLHQTIANSP